jgi:hypothetical protein
VVKDPTNDSGGNAAPDDFLLTVDGGAVLSGVSNEYLANDALVIDETQQSGYEFVEITGDDKCPAELGGTITLDVGDNITCTIVNDDVTAKLTIVKESPVDGRYCFAGTQPDGDIELCVTTEGGSGEGTWDELLSGDYSFTEIFADDSALILASAECDNGDTPDDLTLNVGDDVTCTFVNILPVAVPVNNVWALLMLTLMMLATGWYFRPAHLRRY